jgi:hypothetical protein
VSSVEFPFSVCILSSVVFRVSAGVSECGNEHRNNVIPHPSTIRPTMCIAGSSLS